MAPRWCPALPRGAIQVAGWLALACPGVAALEAGEFASTTKMSGAATFVVGGNGFSGTDSAALQQQAREQEGATTFNYDWKLFLDTSFTGTDLLRIKLRAGNFAQSGFGGGPTVGTNQAALFPNQLEVAFQQRCLGASGQAGDCKDVVGVQRVYYQAPIGAGLTATVGALVRQEEMLAMWPSAYGRDTVLDSFSYAGAPGAYNSNVGPGAGLWWSQGSWALSMNYVAGKTGIGGAAASQTSTVQLGYKRPTFGLAGAYTYSRRVGVASGTPLAVLEVSAMNAVGLSAYWQPAKGGWWPSISAGWGMNTYPGPSTAFNIDVQQSQSWAVGLQWRDALGPGHAAGMAVGQPTFVTRCGAGCSGPPQDGQFAWEWWYALEISDHLTVTPAVFYLSNLLGQISKIETGNNAGSLRNIGVLVKTTLRF